MSALRLGDVTIDRVVEIGRSSFPTASMLPDSTPDAIAAHHSWLRPHFFEGDAHDLRRRRHRSLHPLDSARGTQGPTQWPTRSIYGSAQGGITMPFMRPEIQRLLKQADRDLENARKNLTIHAYEVAAFLSQQAVEKYLKGAWVIAKKEPAPHTHALTELGDSLGVPADLRRHLADLTSDYTVSRYPDAANAVPYELYDSSPRERRSRTRKR